ncbi:Hsp20/alpha crystallin family protein [Patescibacteria group bacterium]
MFLKHKREFPLCFLSGFRLAVAPLMLRGKYHNNEKDDDIEKTEEENDMIDEMEEQIEEVGEGHLTIDMFHTPTEVIIRSMVAGVKPEDLDISISKDMVTLRGVRKKAREIEDENYYYQELYWGGFTRSVLLPHEVDTENAEAKIKNGLLVITLPKIEKKKTQKLKVKTD